MKIIILSAVLFFMVFGFIFLRYRLAYSKLIKGESELKYKMIDIGKGDFIRGSFESLLGKKRVFLKNKVNDIDWLYLNKKDIEKLYPESPLKMKEKKYTMRFKFQAQHLVFGGIGEAKITSFEKINEAPEISKS